MHTPDETTRRQIADFEKHLQETYREQRQLLRLAAMHRMRQDLHDLQSPPQPAQSPPSLISRFGRWLQQQRFSLPFEDLAPWQRIDAELATDPIIIIDASYTVLSAAPESAPIVAQEEEDAQDATPAGGCARCQPTSHAARGQHPADSSNDSKQHDTGGEHSSVRNPQAPDDDS